VRVDPDELAKTAAIDFARRLVPRWQESLSIELLGAYLIGSLAHAGFSRRYSDIDIALITAAGLSPSALDRVRSEAVALSADWGPKVSVFWTDRHFILGRFPLLDRIDYLDHAVVLVEHECVLPARPSLEEIRHYLRGAPLARTGRTVRGASRQLIRLTRRIRKSICGRSSIPVAFTTVG
jgi:predicted nucleotidyltransferase